MGEQSPLPFILTIAMYPSFLSVQQIEELEQFGVVEATDELIAALFEWCNESNLDEE